ncbi:hypothetical protein [Xylanimonas sp. McL0601]|uniref:hypothetical protein n=1 Tax=Xylanimonas sp. McL0601 TaxID=3414739 RepID=UPI003CF4895C
MVATLQVTLVVGPPLAFEITRRVALGLQRKDRDIAVHGHETGRIVRTAAVGYVEIHAPAGRAEVALLTTVAADPSAVGRGGDGRLRGFLRRRFAEGHVRPAGQRLLGAGWGADGARPPARQVSQAGGPPGRKHWQGRSSRR